MAISFAFVKRLRDIMRNDAGVTGDAQRIEQLSWILFLKVYDAKEEDWEFLDEHYHSIIPERLRWRNWATNTKEALTGQPLLNFVDRDLFPTLKTLPVSSEAPRRQSIVREIFEEANNYMKDGTLLRMVLNEVDAAIKLSDTKQAHLLGDLYVSLLRELQAAGAAGEFYTPRPVTDFMARAIRPQIGERMADFACGTGGFITSWLKAMPAPKTPAEQAAIGASVFGIEKKQFPHRLCVTNLLLHDIDAPNILHGNALTQKKLLDYDEDDQFDVVLMNPPYGGSETAAVRTYFPKDLTGSETADLFLALILHRLKPGGRAAVVLPDGFLFGNDAVKRALKQRLLDDFNLYNRRSPAPRRLRSLHPHHHQHPLLRSLRPHPRDLVLPPAPPAGRQALLQDPPHAPRLLRTRRGLVGQPRPHPTRRHRPRPRLHPRRTPRPRPQP